VTPLAFHYCSPPGGEPPEDSVDLDAAPRARQFVGKDD
jgi:hypothetical protein